MVVWIDAQLAPAFAVWFRDTLGVPALAVRDPQLRDADDPVIFHAVREAGAVVLTKDADFVTLLARYEPPAADRLADLRQYDQPRASRTPDDDVATRCRAAHCRRTARRDQRARQFTGVGADRGSIVGVGSAASLLFFFRLPLN